VLIAGAAAAAVGAGGLVVRRFPAWALVDMTTKANPNTTRKPLRFEDDLDFMTIYGKSGHGGVNFLMSNLREKFNPPKRYHWFAGPELKPVCRNPFQTTLGLPCRQEKIPVYI
jgi:hypothetical protein